MESEPGVVENVDPALQLRLPQRLEVQELHQADSELEDAVDSLPDIVVQVDEDF